MARTVTVTLPDAYQDAEFLVVVAPGGNGTSRRADQDWASTVLRITATGTSEVEEVGCGTMRGVLTDAGRVLARVVMGR